MRRINPNLAAPVLLLAAVVVNRGPAHWLLDGLSAAAVVALVLEARSRRRRPDGGAVRSADS